MAKPEWGTKRTCPETGERFYDLGNDNPVTSPNGHQWYPEPLLKSKQPMPFEDPSKKKEDDSDLADDDALDVDESENTADADVDLGGDEDLGVTKSSDDDNEDDN